MSFPGRGEVTIVEAHPLGAETVTGYIDLPIQDQPVMGLTAQRVITASSGTSPTVAIGLEGTLDGSNWFSISTNLISASGAVGTSASTLSVYGSNVLVPQMRLKYTIGGSAGPSVTFSVHVVLLKAA